MNNTKDILAEYSKVISSKLGKFTGVLYGSMARGGNNLWSNIDFLVISDGFWEIAMSKFEEVKKRYERVKEPKRCVSMSMKRSFLRLSLI